LGDCFLAHVLAEQVLLFSTADRFFRSNQTLVVKLFE
jgi:hypothetical protein